MNTDENRRSQNGPQKQEMYLTLAVWLLPTSVKSVSSEVPDGPEAGLHCPANA